MSNITEIGPKQIKDYISSSKSCTFSSVGCKLEARFGTASFDLKSYDSLSKAVVYAKRVSGNGKFAIKYDGKVTVLHVTSKISQSFDIYFEGDKKSMEVFRPADGTGEMYITGIAAHSSVSGDSMSLNWRELIEKCGKYNCLRLVKNRLFASSGGYIEDRHRIKEIVTQPSMHVRDGERIKFLGSCEIVHMVVDGPGSGSKQLYTNREAPGPRVTPNMSDHEILIKQATGGPFPPKQPPAKPDTSSHVNNAVLYDSVAVKGFQKFMHTSGKAVSGIRSNGKDLLVLRKGGKASISVSTLQGNTEYICVVTAKKLNGNGKIQMNISTAENNMSNLREVSFNGGTMSHKYVTLRTGPSKYGQFHKLNLAMMENSSGEVLVERVMVIESIPLHHARGIVEHGHYFPTTLGSIAVSPTTSYSNAAHSSDEVYRASKQYARYAPYGADGPSSDIQGTLAISSVSGVSWYNKISSLFPNVKMVSSTSELTKDTLSISLLGGPIESTRVWLDTFFDYEMVESKFRALERCSTIFSPSLDNVQTLRRYLPDAKVELMSKPIPWVKPKPVEYLRNKEFVLAFHRGDQSTFKLLDSWKRDYPTLALVGARGSFPSNVIPINEYLPYDQLMFVMISSMGIVDISGHNAYESSFLKLAIALNLPVASSNWYALDKKNAVFMPSTENIRDVKVPITETVQHSVERLLSMEKGPRSDMAIYNKKFKEKMLCLLGV